MKCKVYKTKDTIFVQDMRWYVLNYYDWLYIVLYNPIMFQIYGGSLPSNSLLILLFLDMIFVLIAKP